MERALKLALSKSQRSKTQEFSGILNSAHLILIDIESVADGFARRNKFWGISLEDFPRYNGRFAERLVAHVPVPLGDLAMLRLGIGLDPGAYFHGTGTLGDGFPKSSNELPARLRKKLSSGQSKWYSPCLPATSMRHLLRIRAANTQPPRLSQGLRGTLVFSLSAGMIEDSLLMRLRTQKASWD